MARVKDLWLSEVKDPADPTKKIKRKTKRHPDNGGSKDAKRWLAVWIGPDGNEKTKAFRIQDAAKKYARKMEEDAERGEYIDPAEGKKLFGPLGKKWLRLRDVGAGSALRYESVFRLHVEPVFGPRPVGAVKPSEILEWLRKLAKTHGFATQEAAYLIVLGVFDLAVADGMRKTNPATSPIVPKPRKEPTERDVWSTERVWAVTDAHPEPYRPVSIVAAGCGLRQGEDFGLCEDDFDFENGRLHVRRQIVRIGKKIVFKLPKGGKERTVPLSPGVARTVQAHIEAHPPVETTLPWMQEDGELAEDAVMARLLFVWRGAPLMATHDGGDGKRRRRGRGNAAKTEGRNLQTSAYTEMVWKPALAAAGIIPPAMKNRWSAYSYQAARQDGMHALRHYYATTLLDAGVSLAGVMEFMGHSKKGKPVTLGVYGHVTEETYERARNAVDRSLFRLRPVQDHPGSGTQTEQAVSG